jgi:hypothetical protein
MAGHVLKRRRLANPGRRRRMTPAQIKFFGTKRQRAALRNRRRTRSRPMPNRGRRRRNQMGLSQAEHVAQRAIHSVERAAEDAIHGLTSQFSGGQLNRGRRNVGEILTVLPANPGRKRRKNKMAAATRKRRRNRTRARARNRTRRRHPYTWTANPRRRRRHNRRSNPQVVVRYRTRRRPNRRHNRRRNPAALQGDMGAVVGVLAGGAVTKILTSFLPTTLSTGWAGYLTTGLVAVVTGNVAGRMMKDKRFGNMMTIGGLLIVGLQIAGNVFPQLAGSLPFGLATTPGTSGMGLITSSNFYVPQVNMPGSMATFVPPAALPSPVALVPANGMRGLGQAFHPGFRTLRRVGRLR